jgi:hypothetical protein
MVSVITDVSNPNKFAMTGTVILDFSHCFELLFMKPEKNSGPWINSRATATHIRQKRSDRV